MKHPLWLVELHRQWLTALGKQLTSKTRPFSREWPQLLDDAGIVSAEDIATAGREAAKLHDQNKIALKRHKYRHYRIERISLPLASEAWLRGVFSSPLPEDLQQRSLEHVQEAAEWKHPRFPENWTAWLESIRTAFEAGRRFQPLAWQHPDLVHRLLYLTFGLTSREWPDRHLVREASSDLGLDTKTLERSRRILESCLSSMFGRPMSLGMLGITVSQPRIEIAGDLALHLPDNRILTADGFRGSFHLTSDLLSAVKATTSAKRVLTIENTKTTLKRIASLNTDRETLLLACSYPTEGLRLLLALLPDDLPIYHFGDTDPAGYQILSKLRSAVTRPVIPFLMHRRKASEPVPLTGYDRGILPSLLTDPMLEDMRPHLEAISSSGDKGNFEQETLGRPDLGGWPFYSDHPDS